MSSQTNQKSTLLDIVEDVAKIIKFSEKQKAELLQALSGAVLNRLTKKLSDYLPQDKQKELSEKNFKNIEDLAKFLLGNVSDEEFSELASQSTEEVLNKFIDKI